MELADLLQAVVAVLNHLEARYFVTGSVATIAYGEPRFTNDVDIVADLQLPQVDPFVSAFPPPDHYLNRDAVFQAVRGRGQFNLIHVMAGLKVDLIMSRDTEFDRSRFARCRLLPMGAHGEAMFASPEDVILKKLEYFRIGGSEKHLRDIAGVLKVQSGRIDLSYLEDWANRLGSSELLCQIREGVP